MYDIFYRMVYFVIHIHQSRIFNIQTAMFEHSRTTEPQRPLSFVKRTATDGQHCVLVRKLNNMGTLCSVHIIFVNSCFCQTHRLAKRARCLMQTRCREASCTNRDSCSADDASTQSTTGQSRASRNATPRWDRSWGSWGSVRGVTGVPRASITGASIAAVEVELIAPADIIKK